MIYLDNAATTSIDKEVLDAMMPYLSSKYGNPGSIYDIGTDARKAIDGARESLMSFIGAKRGNIIFTSSGSEANTLAILGSTIHDSEDKYVAAKNIVIGANEHDSVINAARMVHDIYKTEIRDVKPCMTGNINEEDMGKAIDSDTVLVSEMMVNNETGSVNNICVTSDMCKEHGAKFHTDCVQAAGTMDIDVGEIGCDYLSLSAHKIHGPKGIGALYVRDLSSLHPVVCGGSGQEFGLRGGTENVANIVGFGVACDLEKKWHEKNEAHYIDISTEFSGELLRIFSDMGIGDRIFFNGVSCGKIVNFGVRGVDSETMILMLSSEGVYLSAGSACSNHIATPSRVLVSMGIEDEKARQSVRVSFDRSTTYDDVHEAARIIGKISRFLIGDFV